MRIARFKITGHPTIAVDAGDGYVDFGNIIEAHGYVSELADKDPERRIIRMLRRGMFEEDFIREELEWQNAPADTICSISVVWNRCCR